MHTLLTLLVSLILSAAVVFIINAYKDHKEVIKLKKSKKLIVKAGKLFKSGNFTEALRLLNEVEGLVKNQPDLITIVQNMRLVVLTFQALESQDKDTSEE